MIKNIKLLLAQKADLETTRIPLDFKWAHSITEPPLYLTEDMSSSIQTAAHS